MADDRIQAGFRAEEVMLLKITHIAKKNYRSLNAQLEFLVRECIEQYEEENGEIAINEEDRYKR